MMFITVVCCMAAANALLVPLYLEDQIGEHEQTPVMLVAGALEKVAQIKQQNSTFVDAWLTDGNATALLEVPEFQMELAKQQAAGNYSQNVNAFWEDTFSKVQGRLNSYIMPDQKQCPDVRKLYRNMRKHSGEISRMQDAEHRALIPLVESALAVMRLSCEKFFVLVTLFVAYLLFRQPPAAAWWLIHLNGWLSMAFQRVILYSFPAICWIYGAGVVFSSFVCCKFHARVLGNDVSISIKCLSSDSISSVESEVKFLVLEVGICMQSA